MSKGFASNYRIVLLAAGVFGAFGAVCARLVWLQFSHRGALMADLERARRAVIVQRGRRGDILDARGNILATSCPLFVLGVDPSDLRPADEKKWPQLAALIGLGLPDLEKILTTKYRPAAPAAATSADWGSASGAKAGWLGRGATALPGESRPAPAAAAGLVFNLGSPTSVGAADADDGEEDDADPDASGRRAIRWAKLADVPESVYDDVQKLGVHGVYAAKVYRREYPNNGLAAQLIGYVNRQEQPGGTGIEGFADFYLKGQSGWIESEKDGRGREQAQFRTREVPASDGYSVALSIDTSIQHLAEAEIDQIVQKCRPQKVTVIVSDPRTGFILGLANYPSFNLNAYGDLRKEEQARLNDVAITDQYEPGSVFKIVAVSGGLNDGLISPDTRFDCALREAPDRAGVLHSLPGEDISDLHYFVHPITVAEVIQHSSNKGTAQVAMRLGADRFYSYVRAFGFGQPTGFPGNRENIGMVASPQHWDGLTITRMPIGQSVGVTPLQMHQAMGVIANGGVLLRPQIVTRIRDAQGDTVFRFGRAEVRRVVSEATARVMARMLQGVASPNGTAPMAEIAGYEVAGKTATAQKLEPVPTASGKPVLRYSTTHHVSSFIGFLPASRPQVEISVIIDDTDEKLWGGVAYGGKVAAPAFNHLANAVISYLHIPKPGGEAPIIAMGGVAP